jgi:hypothetical protein
MATIKDNFLTHFTSTNIVGVVFIFVAVIGLGLALVTSGTIAITHAIQRHNHNEYAKKIIYQPATIQSAVSNEKANPGAIGFFLNGTFAGAITEDGTYTAAETAPAQGTLTILLINPTDSAQPTTVRFPAQQITITDENGTITACLPAMDGDRVLWVDRSGNTYLESSLTLGARSC